ncbi:MULTISPECIES: hypothetical protein [Hyphomicrobiales]|uniref:hypothetical protein n=1 Tax=unclassified Shinella TaxID=2643062 RepID=UPI00225CC4C9|nr:hypothetical protein [Shinella sp. YE25]CAI0337488.1 hypothetical protein SHINE37_41342 [Rhizobiaceae bacterium]CAK7255975.1 protein of unknown function [Shinella sp. WSC3-e]
MFIPSAREFLAAHARAIESLSATRRRFRLGIASHVMGPEVPTLLARLKSDPSPAREDPAARSTEASDTSFNRKAIISHIVLT